MILEKDEFVRAKIAAGATVGQVRRALRDIPDDAVINDAEIEFDYSQDEPFPLRLLMKIEWIKQPDQVDILQQGGEHS